MTDHRTRAFADALQQLESGGEVAGFVTDQFAADAQLLRPETGQQVSGPGATDFWQRYLDQFTQVHSTFDRVSENGALGVLEWTSTGRLPGGADITYRGVSVLDFDEDGHIQRFATYYDTAAFASPAGNGP